MRAASPVPVTAGSPRSQQLRGGFLRRMPEKTAESNSRWALPPSSTPAALWMFPCAEYAARQKLCPAHAGENRTIRFEVGLAPSSAPTALWIFPCAEYAARQKLCPAHAGENRRIQFEVGLAPSSTPAALWMFPCVEQEARQKKRPPQSRGSGAGTVCLIRRETAAGTRAGCSSPPRTAKRHRRERACPCRSR